MGTPELRLFVEQAPAGTSLPVLTNSSAILFFKTFDPTTAQLSFLGHAMFNTTDRVGAVIDVMRKMSGISEPTATFEEIRPTMVERVSSEMTLQEAELSSGDILIIQRVVDPSTTQVRFPTVREFFEFQRDHLVIRFRQLDKPDVDGESGHFLRPSADVRCPVVALEMPKTDSAADVVNTLGHAIRANPEHIRLSGHNVLLAKPNWEPFKARSDLTLLEMVSSWQSSLTDIIYFEVLPVSIAELQYKCEFRVLWVSFDTRPAKDAQTVLVPKTGTVGDILCQVSLSHPGHPLRMLEVMNFKLHREFPAMTPVSSLSGYPTVSAYRVEEVPAEEQALCGTGTHVRAHVVHYYRDERGFVRLHGTPFFFVFRKGATLAEVKPDIQRRLRVTDEVFSKWSFAILEYMNPRPIVDNSTLEVADNPPSMQNGFSRSCEYLGICRPASDL